MQFYYVEPVNLHITTKDRAWVLCRTGVGKLAEFTDAVLAHKVADLLNQSPVASAVAEVAEVAEGSS